MAELLYIPLFGDANLVAYYSTESGALTTDSKGSFTLTNDNTVGEDAGKYGGAADFGTANTNKRLSILNDLGITGGAISISTWVKMNTEISTGSQTFVSQQDTGTHVNYQINYEYNGGTIRVGFYRNRQGILAEAIFYTITLGTSSWHHLVFTYDATNLRGYYNGVLVAGPTAASGNGAGTTQDYFTIGSDLGNTYVSADVDDVAVFTKALSAEEVSTLYREITKSYALFM